MHNNDILRGLRGALRLDDAGVARLVGLAGPLPSVREVRAKMGREEDPWAEPCSDEMLGAFLDGLILDRRGPPDPSRPVPPPVPLSNNEILKKLRIALKLRDADMIEIARRGGQTLSKHELSALFRKRDHRHFRPCGNQLLRRFLRGLDGYRIPAR